MYQQIEVLQKEVRYRLNIHDVAYLVIYSSNFLRLLLKTKKEHFECIKM